MTVDSTIPGRWQEFDGESESGFKQYKDRVYPVPQSGTLAGATVSMQEGDPLPDDNTYEIIDAAIKMVRPLTGATKHKGGRAAVLKGYKEKVKADGSGDWNELVGTRKVLESDPQTLRYEITFTAVTATARPSTSDTYLTITGEASGFTTTDLDREPVVVQVSQLKQATILKSHVTCVFQAHYARTTTGGTFTEINPRIRIATGKNSWKGRRRFSSTVGNAAALEGALFGGIFPGLSGKYAPKCNRVETQDNWEPGRSLVIADYETPRVVGEGKLRIEVGTSKEFVTRDLKGEIIHGVEKVGTKKQFRHRKIVSGSIGDLVPESIIILETAATSFNINTVMDRVRHVNKYRLPNFGNAQPGTLLLLGSPQTTYRLVGDLWYVNYAFKYSGNPKKFPTWNQRLKSQAGDYVVVQTKVVDREGVAVVGVVKHILEWQPVDLDGDGLVDVLNDEIKLHPQYPKSNFRDLGKNLIITGIS